MRFISGKFGLARYVEATGSLGIFDIDSDYKIKFVTTGAAPGNTFEVRGRIQGENTYTLIDTVVSNTTKTIIVEEYDFLEIVCTVFSPVQSQVQISGSGFGGSFGLATVSGTTGQIGNIVDLYFTSSDGSVEATAVGDETIDLKAVSTTVTDATTTTKGAIKLAGDLAGTADLPTVPGLAGKEPTITAGTTAEYFRGDKTFQTLDKTAVGLSNVDNISDADKPVSTAQAAADAAVQAYSIQRTNHTGTQSASTITGLATVATSGSHSDLSGVGTNSHAQIDIALTRLVNTSGTNTGDQDLSGLVPKTTTVNGHALNADVTVTKSDVGLGNVQNLDQTDPANITQDATHRFTNDTDIARLANTSGTNTGDQTTITGNAGTATALQTARTIAGTSFDGTANINIDHVNLQNIGTNTHAQIDSHLASTANPHSVTKTQVGLANVPNIDATVAANITQDSTHRFVTDSQISNWDAGGASAEAIGNTTINNNQASFVSVTGLSFNGAATRSVSIRYSIARATATVETNCVGELDISYNTLSGVWSMINDASNSNAGITFDVSNGGQVTYTSTNISGTGYVGTIRWSAKTFGV